MTVTESGRGHTRDDVARMALRILDDFGLPDLTMRRLAAALDVQASALYWHFPNKQSLLAEISDRIVAQTAHRDAHPDWSVEVRGEAFALRDALLAYRDGAEVVASTLALGLGSTTARDSLAVAIAHGGFDEETSQRAAMAMVHFVLGHVSHEQQRMQYDSLGVLAPTSNATGLGETSLDTTDPMAEFAFGIDLLVGGLELNRARR